MEFYELNRLYDSSLPSLAFIRRLDPYLYLVTPLVVTFGFFVSIVQMIALARTRTHLTSSKVFMLTQCSFQLLLQLVTAAVLVSNYFEKYLTNVYAPRYKHAYLTTKATLHFVYDVALHNVIWLYVVGAIDFCVNAIVRCHLNANYAKNYRDYLQHTQRAIVQRSALMQRRLKYQQRAAVQMQYSCDSNASSSSKMSVPGQNLFVPSAAQSPSSPASAMSFFNEIKPAADSLLVLEKAVRLGCSANDLNEMEEAAEEAASRNSMSAAGSSSSKQSRFCNSNMVLISLVLVTVSSTLLALPHFITYEVHESPVRLSPSPKPPFNELNSNQQQIYFIGDPSPLNDTTNEDGREDFFLPTHKRRGLYSYATKVAKAYGLSFDFSPAQTKLVDEMRASHPHLFHSTTMLNLASLQYAYCNTFRIYESIFSKVKEPLSSQTLESDKMATTTTRGPIIELNVTIVCLCKNGNNNYLMYNTLYFWFEHTMVVSVPFCIVLTIMITLVLISLNVSKLIYQQQRLCIKRKTFQLTHQPQDYRPRRARRSTRRKTIKHPPPLGVDPTTTIIVEPPAARLNNGQSEALFEASMSRAQRHDQSLNIMYIIDLSFYLILALPYTLLRLVLDLFVKDRVKCNLDFFILYKLALLAFHSCLILKFFLMLVLNVRFRSSMARSFSFSAVYCCLSEADLADELQIEQRQRLSRAAKPPKYGCCLCFVCRHFGKSSSTFNHLEQQQNHPHQQHDYYNYTMPPDYHDPYIPAAEDELIESNFEQVVDFNSAYHQFQCPADPEEEADKAKRAVKATNLISV